MPSLCVLAHHVAPPSSERELMRITSISKDLDRRRNCACMQYVYNCTSRTTQLTTTSMHSRKANIRKAWSFPLWITMVVAAYSSKKASAVFLLLLHVVHSAAARINRPRFTFPASQPSIGGRCPRRVRHADETTGRDKAGVGSGGTAFDEKEGTRVGRVAST